MNERLKAYQSWYVENKAFFEALKSHDSVLYTRLYPVYDVLNHLYETHKEDDYLDEDIDKIGEKKFFDKIKDTFTKK